LTGLTSLALGVNNVNLVNLVRSQYGQSCQHRQCRPQRLTRSGRTRALVDDFGEIIYVGAEDTTGLVDAMTGLGSSVDTQQKDFGPAGPSRCDHPLREPKLHLPWLQIRNNHNQPSF